MTKVERDNWITNLEDISSQVDAATVKFVCEKYGAKSIYGIHSCDLNDAWNKLFQYAVDAND